MSEPDNTTDTTIDAQQGDTGSGNYTPPATQAELDRIVSDRVNRTKAQFKDYNDLKAKAAELDQIKQANQTEAERQAQELQRWQADAEKWRGTAVKSRIETLAADFADPTDALAAIGDPAQFLDAGGQINDEAIRTELASVLERKPHWRRQDAAPATPRPPAPNRAQGAGGNAATNPADALAAILQGQLRS